MSNSSYAMSFSQRRALGGVLLVLLTLGLVALALAADSMLLAMIASAAETPKNERYTLTGAHVAIYNIAGELKVQAATGKAVEVEVTRDGSDAGQLAIKTGPIGEKQTLRVIYPSDRIVYPKMGHGSRTDLHIRDDGTFNDGGNDWADRTTVSGSGSGLEAHADLLVKVPAGQTIDFNWAVGTVSLTNVDGHIKVDVGSADITATGTRGVLSLDTGSGDLRLSKIAGDVTCDTGSGDVELSAVNCDRFKADTGSGDIEGTDLVADDVNLDTGSGDIRVGSVKSGHVSLDTGSGSVDIGLAADIEKLAVDTGSGDITVRVPKGLGAEVTIESSSGDINTDLPLELIHHGSDNLRGRLGDGRGSMHLETGSGSVRLMAAKQ